MEIAHNILISIKEKHELEKKDKETISIQGWEHLDIVQKKLVLNKLMEIAKV